MHVSRVRSGQNQRGAETDLAVTVTPLLPPLSGLFASTSLLILRFESP